MSPKLKRLVTLLPFLGIILTSFFIASPLYTPWYNSDHAVHVLMVEKFDWTADWYYWGQDRLGSWIPLFGQFFNKIFQFNAIWSASLALYFTLIFGFYFFQSFLKTYALKVVLSLAYFMPLALFNNQVFLGHPYASQLFFIGASLFLLQSLRRVKNPSSLMLSSFALGLSCIVSVWISDVSFALFPFYVIFFFLDEIKVESNSKSLSFQVKRLNHSARYIIFPLLLSLFLASGLLSLAKAGTISDPRYAEILANKNEIKGAIILFLNTIQESLLFRVNNVLVSFQTLLLCLVLISGLFFSLKMKDKAKQLRNYTFICMTFFLLLLLLASNWVTLFRYDLRYFTIVYILFICGLCYLWDSLESKVRKIGIILLSIAVALGTIHFIISHNKDFSHTKKEITFKTLKKEAEKLPPCTLIGTYWNGYNLASTRPSDIIAIPHDKHYARNPWELEKALKKDKIFLISNDWLDDYPNDIFQRGYFLKKSGDPFKLDIYTYCEYKQIKQFPIEKFDLLPESLNFNGSSFVKDSIALEANLKTQYLGLVKGKYSFKFEIESDQSIRMEGVVYHKYGQRNFLVKELINGKNNLDFSVNDEEGIFLMIKIYGLGKAGIKLGHLIREY